MYIQFFLQPLSQCPTWAQLCLWATKFNHKLQLNNIRIISVVITVERVFFTPGFFPLFSENEVFTQCYFHDFRFICSLSLVIFSFRVLLFSQFFFKSRKTWKYNGCKKNHILQYFLDTYNIVCVGPNWYIYGIFVHRYYNIISVDCRSCNTNGFRVCTV